MKNFFSRQLAESIASPKKCNLLDNFEWPDQHHFQDIASIQLFQQTPGHSFERLMGKQLYKPHIKHNCSLQLQEFS